MEYLKENLTSFVYDGPSIILGRKSAVAKPFLDDSHCFNVWHCACHRLQLCVSDAVDEVAGLNNLRIL
jgi:hypothetical protein